MKSTLNILILLLVTFTSFAQEETVYSIYFEFDDHKLDNKQGNNVVAFIKAIDTTRIETIQIFGYTDDRGKDDYNYKLSSKRANTIKKKMMDNGIKNKIIVTIEGKGRILLEDDINDVSEARSYNRRVDVMVNFEKSPPLNLEPSVYKTVEKDMTVGDHIYLEKILFERGSSKLTRSSAAELEKIARLLHKYKNFKFEIQGHVCCTPSYQKEAIDKGTRKRELSINRAKTVYRYLIKRRINPKRMTHKGYGNTVPLGKGSEYDRRVELVITEI
ncbi:MAG: hypothetical protein BM557_11140 [Flavobacterium sp. MedPE-SWcel]|uniref:OmpA family protein n=1 Tax=uncultured Flavobacterium sp. TaxID=165435 RepID=UPI0009147E3B|nr:OmpA family protein [uncultured Flavobacterium sp.]OIQ15598.1 MAG: hypothetical protein BM557_11140 [Flavobacterium sp. MedPE-SWcel]